MTQNENDVISKVNNFHEGLKQLHNFATQQILPNLDKKLEIK